MGKPVRFSERLTVRLQPKEQELLRRAAALNRQSVSEFSRTALVPLARRRVLGAVETGHK